MSGFGITLSLLIICVVGWVFFNVVCFLWYELMVYLTIKHAREQDRLDEEYRVMVDEKLFVENEDKYYLNRIGICDGHQ